MSMSLLVQPNRCERLFPLRLDLLQVFVQAERPEQDINREQRSSLAQRLLERPLNILRPRVPQGSPLQRPLHMWSLLDLESLISDLWGPDVRQSGPWFASSFGPIAQQVGETPTQVQVRPPPESSSTCCSKMV